MIAGDATEPAGPYEGALPFIRDLLDADPGVARVGFAGYPDGHAFIDAAELAEQLHAKQALLADAGVDGWISTQMCFDARSHPSVARPASARPASRCRSGSASPASSTAPG